jgi:hypothetical protein
MEQFLLGIDEVYQERTMIWGAKPAAVQAFLEDPTWPAPDAGMDLPIAQLLQLVDATLDGQEDETLKLFRTVSKQTADALVTALQQLEEEVRHPCTRGDADLAIDMFYPLIQPFLGPDQNPSLEDLLPVLTLLHSGMYETLHRSLSPLCTHCST